MKISAYYMVLNEEDWIDLSIKSIYDIVDEIIVVEGACNNAKFMANEKGLSIDRTEERIRNFKDYNNKIKYIQKGFVNYMIDLKNECLNNLSKDCDYFIVLSGDEFYKKEELEYLFKYIENPEDANIFSVNHILFYRSPFYIKHDPRDMCCNKIYKKIEDMVYTNTTDDTFISFTKEKRKILRFCYTNMYHFSLVKSRKRLIQKCMWRLNHYGEEKVDFNEGIEPLKWQEILNMTKKKKKIF